MYQRVFIITGIIAILLSVACSRRPSDVPDEEEMASLLADMHKAEMYISTDQTYAMNDSMRLVLRQSVLANHNINEPQFQNALDWYGHNIDLFGDVYDRTEEIVKQEAAKGSAAVTQAAKTDNSQLWFGPTRAALSRQRGETHLTFEIQGKELGEADRLEWTFTVPAMPGRVTAFIGVDYSDGSNTYSSQTFNIPGLQRINITPEKNRGSVVRVFGQSTFFPNRDETLLVDSISLRKL